MGKKISALVVDDSALMRNLISKMLESDPVISVAATAMNGEFALEKTKRYSPDIIILDLEMPVMNGIEFLKRKKAEGLEVPVIILSSMAKKGAEITMEALSLGALDFILKPSGSVSRDIEMVCSELVQMVKIYSGKKDQDEDSSPPDEHESEKEKAAHLAPFVSDPKKGKSVRIAAIGVSTGGPNALRQILPSLDKSFPVPLVIVQHMPAGFTEEFAKSLNRICPLEVKEAEEGDVLKAGRIFIAPGDRHLLILKRSLANIITLDQGAPVNGHRPSVDVLFSSIADVYRDECLAVIMTGMGKDGVKEIGTIYRCGGITIAQEESTCVVPGMPKGAIKKGYIRHIVPLDRMGEAINKVVKEKP